MTENNSGKTSKRGAPKKAEGQKRTKFHPFGMTDQERIRYGTFAEKKGMTISGFLRIAAEEYIRNHPD